MTVEDELMTQAKGLVAPVSKFFQFIRDKVAKAFFQFSFKQIRTKANFLQNGLYIFQHGHHDLVLLTVFKQGNEGFSQDVTLFLEPLSIE